MVSADRVLTKVHGKRAPWDRETCTETCTLAVSNLHGLGCRLSPFDAARLPCR